MSAQHQKWANLVKAWKNIYSDFIVKSQKEQEKSEQELDKAIHELYQ
ncbi:hypothetical protein KK059_006060 [Streptococcus salivarius]|nr:hypothetical protein [Streptococcus salivarius]MBT2136198.1 hypothetical protein [Streptococcus salivarius]